MIEYELGDVIEEYKGVLERRCWMLERFRELREASKHSVIVLREVRSLQI